jgi:hypothetical protein
MATKHALITVQQPTTIRERLAAIVAEARSLRRLLKLSEAAYRAQEESDRSSQAIGVKRGHDG